MTHYFRALSAEFLKLRRTLAFWCILIAPTLLAVLTYGMLLGRNPSTFGTDFKPWEYSIDNGFSLWALLVLPLYIALQTTLLAQLEHTSSQWKHLYALPVPRIAYYAAKWTVMVAVILVTHALLALELAAGGKLAHLLAPTLGLSAPIPWSMLLQGFATISGGALLILTLHLLISLWWRSFIPSLGLGVMAVISSVFVMSSDTLYKFDPWLFPGLAFRGEGSDPQVSLTVGLGGGLLLAVVGGFLFTRKQVTA